MAAKFEFTPLPQDIEEGNIKIQTQQDCHKWEMALRMALIGIFMVGFAFRLRQSQTLPPPPPLIPPTFLVNSLSVPHFNISDGELSATWNVKLAISSAVNFTIRRLDASIWYQEIEALASFGPEIPLDLGVVPEQEKRVNLKFKTTGWEKDQPIVDDTVIVAMAENRKRRVIRFGLKMRVKGELCSGEWVRGFVTQSTCPDLEVRFPPPGQEDAATLIRSDSISCSGFTEWGPVRGLL